MLNVFITVDTEITARTQNWRTVGLDADARRDIWGETPDGERGLRYQIDLLNQYGVRASFMIDPFSLAVAGGDLLSRVIHLIQDAGQEVQLHLHTEWIGDLAPPPLGGRRGNDLSDFSQEEQAHLIRTGLDLLTSRGARDICAFRAGNYGANLATLRAVAQNGLTFDTSYNPSFKDSHRRFFAERPTHRRLLQPESIDGVLEFPIAFFHDWPGHRRHAQICATSSEEMEHALDTAWRRGWSSFVIVSHSFELIQGRGVGEHPAADAIVTRRFRRLCAFLAANADRFAARHFKDVKAAEIHSPAPIVAPITSNVLLTARRLREQYERRRARASTRTSRRQSSAAMTT